MRILFLCDFFPPFTIGGAEISSYWQAKKLIAKGFKVITLAPRFEDSQVLKKENFTRYWYKLPFKIKNFSPIFFLNPIFVIYLFIQIFRIAKKEKIDLIHCQGKYSSPAATIVKFLKKIPLIITLRDYKGICNHGFCLYNNKKGCNLITFFKKDFIYYYRHYIKKKNIFTFLTQFFLSFFGRVNTYILSFFMKKADKFICVSNYIKEVYAFNGFDNNKMQTIYNFMPGTSSINKGTSKHLIKIFNKYEFIILYAGKLSLGKGADLLIEAALKIAAKRNDVLFAFAGAINYPINLVRHQQLLFLNNVEHSSLMTIMKLADLICIPSVWPEPLSRVIIEAFSLGKPVLASNRGGSKELINEQRGWLFQPNPIDLAIKLDDALKDKQRLKILGMNGKMYISNLEEEQIDKLIKLYTQLSRVYYK